MYTLVFAAMCKTACTSETVDVLYTLLLLGTHAIANPGSGGERKLYIMYLKETSTVAIYVQTIRNTAIAYDIMIYRVIPDL